MLYELNVAIYHFSRTPENCALLTFYAACSDISLPTFRDNLLVPSSRINNLRIMIGFLTLEDGTDKLSRNVGNKLPVLAA